MKNIPTFVGENDVFVRNTPIMPKIIYSERYFSESYVVGNSPLVLNFKHKKEGVLSEEHFIKKAIFLSHKERIGLDILETKDRMSADFISKAFFFSEESTALFAELTAEADLIEIIITDSLSPSVRLRLGRFR